MRQDGLAKGDPYDQAAKRIAGRLTAASELQTAIAAHRQRAAAPPRDPRWEELYLRACARRRAARLGTLLEKAPRIVFTKHYDLGGSHYAYTEGQSDAQAERHFEPGIEPLPAPHATASTAKRGRCWTIPGE